MNINKFFKISIIMAILIIAGSILYYLVIYLPKRNIELGKQALLEQSRECKTMADKFIDGARKEADKLNLEVSISDITVHFNKKLNTCLISYTETCAECCRMHTWCWEDKVVNVLTNKKLINQFYMDSIGYSPSDFDSIKQSLMSE